KGAVELRLSRPDLDDKSRARLQRIQRAERQGTDLISALLLLSRNERGHGAADVGRIAEQLLDMHRAQLGGKPLELRLEGERGLVSVISPALMPPATSPSLKASRMLRVRYKSFAIRESRTAES